ncbi:MAG: hypothetical protein WD766_04095, partial [Gemmatimonadota bacterium]
MILRGGVRRRGIPCGGGAHTRALRSAWDGAGGDPARPEATSVAPVSTSTTEIAEQFSHLYWPQVNPFVTHEEEEILRQNTGRQAAVVREGGAHERYDGSLAALQRDGPEWTRLLRSVRRTVEVMPLWKLQTVGADRLEFLYPNLDRGHL